MSLLLLFSRFVSRLISTPTSRVFTVPAESRVFTVTESHQMLTTIAKAPKAVKDYQINWASWLGTDTISSVSWEVSPTGGLSTTAGPSTTTTATVWLTGGALRRTYTVTCRVVTAGGRTEEARFWVRIRES